MAVDIPVTCPTECDDDCTVGCHEYHYPWMKRDHDPEDCPGLRAMLADTF